MRLLMQLILEKCISGNKMSPWPRDKSSSLRRTRSACTHLSLGNACLIWKPSCMVPPHTQRPTPIRMLCSYFSSYIDSADALTTISRARGVSSRLNIKYCCTIRDMMQQTWITWSTSRPCSPSFRCTVAHTAASQDWWLHSLSNRDWSPKTSIEPASTRSKKPRRCATKATSRATQRCQQQLVLPAEDRPVEQHDNQNRSFP